MKVKISKGDICESYIADMVLDLMEEMSFSCSWYIYIYDWSIICQSYAPVYISLSVTEKNDVDTLCFECIF